MQFPPRAAQLKSVRQHAVPLVGAGMKARVAAHVEEFQEDGIADMMPKRLATRFHEGSISSLDLKRLVCYLLQIAGIVPVAYGALPLVQCRQCARLVGIRREVARLPNDLRPQQALRVWA